MRLQISSRQRDKLEKCGFPPTRRNSWMKNLGFPVSISLFLFSFLLFPFFLAADWPMLGGNANRNMVNTVEKNIPQEWSVKEAEQKNVKWVAELGTTSYGGPVVAGGKIYVGTNNGKPRNASIKGDRG